MAFINVTELATRCDLHAAEQMVGYFADFDANHTSRIADIEKADMLLRIAKRFREMATEAANA